jgi:hypothetical protein
MKKAFALLLLVPLLTQVAHSQSTLTCTTHFYNKSNFKWSISNFNGLNTSLMIQPNSTLAIVWGNTATVTISGDIPHRPYVKTFQVQVMNGCVVLQSQGPTAGTFLNQPSNGDITTCSGGC